MMIWLYLSREELLQRMRARAADRDKPKLNREQEFLDRLELDRQWVRTFLSTLSVRPNTSCSRSSSS